MSQFESSFIFRTQLRQTKRHVSKTVLNTTGWLFLYLNITSQDEYDQDYRPFRSRVFVNVAAPHEKLAACLQRNYVLVAGPFFNSLFIDVYICVDGGWMLSYFIPFHFTEAGLSPTKAFFSPVQLHIVLVLNKSVQWLCQHELRRGRRGSVLKFSIFIPFWAGTSLGVFTHFDLRTILKMS